MVTLQNHVGKISFSANFFTELIGNTVTNCFGVIAMNVRGFRETLAAALPKPKNRDFARGIFSIDRDCPKPRKDIANWEQVKDFVSYFYDEIYTPDYTLPENISAGDAAAILQKYIGEFDINDDKDAWFARIKAMCEPLGYTPNVKEYKKDPTAFR